MKNYWRGGGVFSGQKISKSIRSSVYLFYYPPHLVLSVSFSAYQLTLNDVSFQLPNSPWLNCVIFIYPTHLDETVSISATQLTLIDLCHLAISIILFMVRLFSYNLVDRGKIKYNTKTITSNFLNPQLCGKTRNTSGRCRVCDEFESRPIKLKTLKWFLLLLCKPGAQQEFSEKG